MNERERNAFLTYADIIIAECHRIRFEEGIPGSARYSNMDQKLKESRQFYVLGHGDGREKMAKELITILTALETAEEKICAGIVKQTLAKISGDIRWKPKKKN